MPLINTPDRPKNGSGLGSSAMIGVEGHPLVAVQLKQRVGRDLDELAVRNGVTEDDQRVFLALHRQPGARVVLTLARRPGHGP